MIIVNREHDIVEKTTYLYYEMKTAALFLSRTAVFIFIYGRIPNGKRPNPKPIAMIAPITS